jgi:hypothetical protein
MNQLTLTALATNELAQSGVGEEPAPARFQVSAVFPNPSRGPASFRVYLDKGADVRLVLYDVAGRLADSRGSQYLDAGEHVLTWTPAVRGAGTYYLRFSSGSDTATTRWVILP